MRPGDRVLDIGCGAGQTTRDAGQDAAPGIVLGVDVSERMLVLMVWQPRTEALRETLAAHAPEAGVQFDSATWIVQAE